MKTKVVQLSGGVGGARLARGFAALEDVELTVIVNVGDDNEIHGLRVSPDLDTVCYTLAGLEGPMGWGRDGDSFRFNDELARFGVENSFRLGDLDLALKVARTDAMANGRSLSDFTAIVTDALGLTSTVLPATDDFVRTRVEIESGWTSFSDYFVTRRHRDRTKRIEFSGAANASPAAGVVESIVSADYVVIGPSNPVLSIWPILAVPAIAASVEARGDLIAVSPFIAKMAVKGPAREVLEDHGLTPDAQGIRDCYPNLLRRLYVDEADVTTLEEVEVVGTDIMLDTRDASKRLAKEIVNQ